MPFIRSHAKSLLALAFALFMLLQPWFVGAQTFTSHDWVKVAIAGVGLLVAYVAANTSTTIGRYAKEIAVILTAALVSLDNVIDGPWSNQKLMQVIAAAVIAAGVLVSPKPVEADLPGEPMDDRHAGHRPHHPPDPTSHVAGH